jgi:hypothetical protein
MLAILSGNQQLDHYKELLLNLGKPDDKEVDGDAIDNAGESKQSNEASNEQLEDAEANEKAPIVKEIYANASSLIKKPVTLNKLVSEIEKLDWYSAREEELGDLYEGLLQKNAEEKKSGAGQYFTPQPLIDSMVAVMQPTLEDVIQDPAAGTGGFPIAALHWIREHHDISELDEKQQKNSTSARFMAWSTCRTRTASLSGLLRRSGRPIRRKLQLASPRGVVGARLQPTRFRALLMPPPSLPISSPRCCANAAP